MKKGKLTMTITIGIICFILCYVMFIQFKTVEETNITQIELMRETELREMISVWKEKYEETNEELESTQTKIEEYKEKSESNQEASELLDEELLKAKTLAGLTDVKGKGIIITIKDQETENGIVEAYELLDLVNELKLAGAEAISINDQRITNLSDIVNVSVTDVDRVILVNSKRISSPYVIKAIGSQQYLESALTTKTVGYMDLHSEKDIKIERDNNITILKYTGEIKLKYSQDKEE